MVEQKRDGKFSTSYDKRRQAKPYSFKTLIQQDVHVMDIKDRKTDTSEG